MRTNCMSCGATIDIARLVNSEVTVPLEVHTDPSSDADRYRVVDLNPLVVEPVNKGAAGDYFPDHRADCPAYRSADVAI